MKLKVGDKVRPTYRGQVVAEYEVKKIAKLEEPRKYYSIVKGDELFNPTIILLEALDDGFPTLGKGHKELWFPYWIATSATNTKERYGQFAPMFTEDVFLELLEKAIEKGFFTKPFLARLNHTLESVLHK